jgi:basic membrane protein A
MKVQFTGSWYDEGKEQEAANALLSKNCVLISQHADSMGAPSVCETAGVPNIAYNGSTVEDCPNTFIIASAINWAPYYYEIIKASVNGTDIPANYTGTISTGSVVLSLLNTGAAAEGTETTLKAVAAELIAGTRKVFDTNTFTVKGQKLTEYLADVIDNGDFQGETNVIIDGEFVESGDDFRSAPYFDLRIDGITEINN